MSIKIYNELFIPKILKVNFHKIKKSMQVKHTSSMVKNWVKFVEESFTSGANNKSMLNWTTKIFKDELKFGIMDIINIWKITVSLQISRLFAFYQIFQKN